MIRAVRLKMMKRLCSFSGETTSSEVISCSAAPELTCINDSGATPKNVPTKKVPNGILTCGEAMLTNQFGMTGVMRARSMKNKRFPRSC